MQPPEVCNRDALGTVQLPAFQELLAGAVKGRNLDAFAWSGMEAEIRFDPSSPSATISLYDAAIAQEVIGSALDLTN